MRSVKNKASYSSMVVPVSQAFIVFIVFIVFIILYFFANNNSLMRWIKNKASCLQQMVIGFTSHKPFIVLYPLLGRTIDR